MSKRSTIQVESSQKAIIDAYAAHIRSRIGMKVRLGDAMLYALRNDPDRGWQRILKSLLERQASGSNK